MEQNLLINNIVKIVHIQTKMLAENHTNHYIGCNVCTEEGFFLFYIQSLAENSASGKILKHLLNE